ncbi:MAG: hypothetical protein OQJ89_13095, partial [Kangiellaceae bacterium]|nr:hypothetical protein [Kangiellaceae bacterium]
MKLQITDSDKLSSLNSRSTPLDMEVAGKLLDKPLQIESVLMKSNRLTQITLLTPQSSNSTAKTADIPKNLLLELSQSQLTKLLSGSQQIVLNRIGNTIQLKTTVPISNQNQSSQPLIQTLAFTKVVAVDKQTVLLANLINKGELAGRSESSNALSSTQNNLSNDKVRANELRQPPPTSLLKGSTHSTKANTGQPNEHTQQLISQALKAILKNDTGSANSTVAKHFNQLNENTHLLAQRILGLSKNEAPNTLYSNFKLNDSVTLLKELVQANYLPINNKLAAGLRSLLNLLNSFQQIQAIANPSDKKASVSIQNRLLQSGNFMESNLAQAPVKRTPPQSTSTINQVSQTYVDSAQSKQVNLPNSRTSSQPLDLKFILKDFYQHSKHFGQFIEQNNKLTPLIQKLAQSPLLQSALNQVLAKNSVNTSHNSNLNLAASTLVLSHSTSESQNTNSKLVQTNIVPLNQLTNLTSNLPNLTQNLNFSARTIELLGHYVNWLQLKPSHNKAKLNNNQQLDIQAYKELLGNLHKSSEAMLQRIETNQLLSARAANMGLIQ